MKRFPYLYALIVFFLYAAQPWAAPTIMEKDAAIEMKQLEKKAQDKGRVSVIVELNEDLSEEELAKLTKANNGKKPNIHQVQEKALMKEVPVNKAGTVKHYDNLPYVAMTIDKRELARLRKSGLVKDIMEDTVLKPMTHTREATLGEYLGADVAWNSGYTGKGQSIAVIDSGVDRFHPGLRGRVVREACFSSRIDSESLSGGQIVSPNCRGGRTSAFGRGAAGVDCLVGDVGCAHGTYVALFAAMNSGAPGFAGSGMAPEAKIIGIKAESFFNLAESCAPETPPCLRFQMSDLVRSLDYILSIHRRQKVAVVNMSLGGPGNNCFRNPLRRAVRLLRKARVATVISSGNDGTPYTISEPACIPEAISVGSTHAETHVISDFSNGARSLDLLAPGEAISVPYFKVDPVGAVNPGEALQLQGTSFSAPLVSGAWASLKSHKPKASVNEILQVLKATGVSIIDFRNATIKPEIRLDEAHKALGP